MNTVAAIAARLSVSQATVRRACERVGIAKIAGRYLLTDEQVESLREHIHDAPGCPTMTEGNQLWRKRQSEKQKRKRIRKTATAG